MKTRFGEGRFEVLRTLGQGATSEVYEVLDTRLGARRALKRMVAAPTPEARVRQEREAAIMARLDHPNVVTVLDAFEEDGHRCVLMELCEGGSLATRVELEGPLPPAEVVVLGASLEAALAAAHRSGVLHRDLKPANILFGPTGDPRIADFGLSLLSQDDETLTRTGALLGTVPFMAPELRRGEAHTEASDRYALAATLAWSATGTFPADLDRVGSLDGLPEPVATVVGRLIAGDDRVSEAEIVRHRQTRRSLRLGLGLVALGAAGALGWWVRPAPPPVPGSSDHALDGLAAYAALPLCDRGATFGEWDKYPHYNADLRLAEEAAAPLLFDMDGDGDLDLAVPYVLGVAVDVFVNEGGTLFQRTAALVGTPPLRLEADVAANASAVGDLDGDGRQEALWLKRNRMGFEVLRMNEAGGMQVTTDGLGDPAGSPVLVDTNGDGCDDLLFATLSVSPALRVRHSSCNGTLEVAELYLDGWSVVAHEGPHLVVQHADGRVGRLVLESSDVLPIPGSAGVALAVRASTGLVASGLPPGTRALVGLDAEGGLCRGPLYKSVGARTALGDVDLDGVLDRVRTMSCGYCTSQVLLDRGKAVD